MLKVRFVIAPLAAFAVLSVHAQGWTEFESLEDSFRVNFPAEPVIEQIEYLSEFDAILPARRYTVARWRRNI